MIGKIISHKMLDKKLPALLNHEVLKPSGAIHIEHKITMTEQQIWNKLFQNCYKSLETGTLFTIQVKDILKIFPYECQNIAHLKKCFKSLVETSVEFNVFDKDKQEWGMFSLLSEVKIKNGICSYAYSPTLQELMQNREMYTKVNLLIQQRFTSKYALFVYELCLDYAKVSQTPMMKLEVFRHYLGLQPQQYKEFKAFNMFVLKPAVEEINTKTDLFLKIERTKTGRKVSGIKIWITPNPKKQTCTEQDSLFPVEENLQVLEENHELEEQIKKVCGDLARKHINKVLKNFSSEKIKIALQYTKERAKDSRAGYFLELLKDEQFGEEEIQLKKRREERIKKEMKDQKAQAKKEAEDAEIDKQVQDFIKGNPEKYESFLEDFWQTKEGLSAKSQEGVGGFTEKLVGNIQKMYARKCAREVICG